MGKKESMNTGFVKFVSALVLSTGLFASTANACGVGDLLGAAGIGNGYSADCLDKHPNLGAGINNGTGYHTGGGWTSMYLVDQNNWRNTCTYRSSSLSYDITIDSRRCPSYIDYNQRTNRWKT